MHRSTRTSRALIAFMALGGGLLGFAAFQDGDFTWKVHDPDRPKPTVVTPGMPGTPTTPGTAPSDAQDWPEQGCRW